MWKPIKLMPYQRLNYGILISVKHPVHNQKIEILVLELFFFFNEMYFN